MPHTRNSVDRALAVVVLLVTLGSLAPALQAQQAEIPPPAETAIDDPNINASESQRIVEGRPRFYTIKRALHPISWVNSGMRPIVRLAEKAAGMDTSKSPESPPRDSGVKYWIQGLGSSTGFGPEIKPYHKNLFNRGIEVEVPLIVTYKLYQSGRFRANFPLISGGPLERLGFVVTGGYASRPSDRFFGIGNDTSASLESRFRSVTRDAGVGLEARMNDAWSARIETSYRNVGITRPRKFTSALDVYQGADIPGLTEDPGGAILSTTALLQRDNTSHPHLPDSGGIQRLEVTLAEGRSGGDFSYWRYSGGVQQFFSLSSDRRKIIALRANVETNQEKGGSTVPFFDLPTLGSSSTVRGFQTRRFTDKSAMSVSAEYRYRIWRFFDWGLFADAGQVAPEIGDFDMNGFHKGYGMRFIVRTSDKRAVFFTFAHSREERLKFYVDFSPLF